MITIIRWFLLLAAVAGSASIGISQPVYGQQNAAAIRGAVAGEDGEPLPGAHVRLENTGQGDVADSEGRFAIRDLDPGSYTLIARFSGYADSRRRVELGPGEQAVLEWELEPGYAMPQIEVIGRRPGRFERIPGATAHVDGEVIRRTRPLSGHEVLRTVSGINAVEEEGLGLRANIGIRGLDPSRSRNVLMLEDGIPIALAPYGEPEMYYSPPIERMDGVEVIKGSGSIRFGPQTFGGVINYTTPDPPGERQVQATLRGGPGGYLLGKASYGNTFDDAGIQTTYLYRQGEKVGITEFGVHDLNSKLKLVLDDRSVLGIKIGLYDEHSNSTYVGLTQPMYASGAFDFQHPAPFDRLRIRRYSATATHEYQISDDVQLQTTAFGYTTTRNWSRQDFDNVPDPQVQYNRVFGTEKGGYEAIYFRDATGNRNRSFEVAGFNPRLNAESELAGLEHELDAGLRVLFERAYEQRIDGTMRSPASGDLRHDESRSGFAVSGFFQNRIWLTGDWTATPGLRVERYEFIRDIHRLNHEDVQLAGHSRVLEFIPGIGMHYEPVETVALFGGVHRGYGPPRVKDAISPEGRVQQLDAERSWNYELGVRARPLAGMKAEVTGYRMNFSNQVIPVAEASGGSGMFDADAMTNAGATEHYGVEAGFDWEISRLLNAEDLVRWNSSATLSQARFRQDRFVRDDTGERVNVKGNDLPYAPQFMLNSRVAVDMPFGFTMQITGDYRGSQYGDPLNRTEPTPDGREGRMDGRFVLNLAGSYSLPWLDGAELTASVNNVFDRRYIASRRPQGIRLGMPRFVTAGLEWRL